MIREFFSPRVFLIWFLLWIVFLAVLEIWKHSGPPVRRKLLKGFTGLLVTAVVPTVLIFGVLLFLN